MLGKQITLERASLRDESIRRIVQGFGLLPKQWKFQRLCSVTSNKERQGPYGIAIEVATQGIHPLSLQTKQDQDGAYPQSGLWCFFSLADSPL